MNTKSRPVSPVTLSAAASVVLLCIVAGMLLLAVSVAVDPGATTFDGRCMLAVVLAIGTLGWFVRTGRSRG